MKKRHYLLIAALFVIPLTSQFLLYRTKPHTIWPTVKNIAQMVDSGISSTDSQLGKHIIAELIDCSQNLNNKEGLETMLRKAALQANASVLSITTHQFEPVGISGIVVLKESHISVHTWPENKYVSVDIYTCGKNVKPERALRVLQHFFKPATVDQVTLMRGCNL